MALTVDLSYLCRILSYLSIALTSLVLNLVLCYVILSPVPGAYLPVRLGHGVDSGRSRRRLEGGAGEKPSLGSTLQVLRGELS